MTDPFIGEIRMFAGNFPPLDWALCNGQLMSISQNTALFSILGTTYGGNGTTNFALPNLMGTTPMQSGQGNGLSQRFLGEEGGTETVTLQSSEMPSHGHQPMAYAGNGNVTSPQNAVWAEATVGRQGDPLYQPTPNTAMHPLTTGSTGGGQPHNNMPPYLAVSFIIALQGVFPSRP